MGILVECQKWMDKSGVVGRRECKNERKQAKWDIFRNIKIYSPEKSTQSDYGVTIKDFEEVDAHTNWYSVQWIYTIKQRTVIVITLFILMVLCVFVPKIVIRFRWFSFIRAKFERECVAVLAVVVLLLLRQKCHFIWFLVSHDTC